MTGNLGPHGNGAAVFLSAPEPLNMIVMKIFHLQPCTIPAFIRFFGNRPDLQENLRYLGTTFQQRQLPGKICETDRSDTDGLAIGQAKAS
jgi:hypothetical protein